MAKLSEKVLKQWAYTRRLGKTEYAWTRGAFAYGGTLLVAATIVEFWLSKPANFYAHLGFFTVSIPGCLWLGFRYGKRTWDTYEEQFQNYYADPENPRPAKRAAYFHSQPAEEYADHQPPPPKLITDKPIKISKGDRFVQRMEKLVLAVIIAIILLFIICALIPSA